MREKTDWTPKNKSRKLHTSGSRKDGNAADRFADSKWKKAGLAIAAGVVIAILAGGVKGSDYYD